MDGSTAAEQSQSATDALTSNQGKSFLKYIVGMFTAVGGGYVVGTILLSIVEGDVGAAFGIVAFFIPIFGAPIISMMTGIYTGLQMDGGTKSQMAVSGVGAFIGFFILLILLVIAAAIVDSNGGGGGGSGSLSDLFGPLIAFGLGVAASGAGATYVLSQTDVIGE